MFRVTKPNAKPKKMDVFSVKDVILQLQKYPHPRATKQAGIKEILPKGCTTPKIHSFYFKCMLSLTIQNGQNQKKPLAKVPKSVMEATRPNEGERF
jgi:hypothetical protein